MKWTVLLVLTAGLLIAADDKADAVKKEMQKLEGTWAASTITVDGMAVPAEDAKDMRIIFKDGKYTVKVKDKTLDEGALEIDPTKSPKTFELKGSVGEKKGMIDPGIYKLEGDTLTTCLGPTNKNRRPTDFVSKEGTGDELITFKRVKP